ncbi:MAG: SDR family oxidoreductase [Lachnospiraceae bacterium]|nr:SDR family oxidoreductase [Lachnospiraceae bacterium]
MKVVLAGAFGHLGEDILRSLVRAGHNVIAGDMVIRELEGCTGFTPVKIDMTDREALKGLCDGADVVITTVGLTRTSATLTNYDIDWGANKNLVDEAVSAGVKHFAYVSVLKADKAPDVPMLDAKAKLEAYLKESGMKWVIFRPTGYFYDIAKVFMPMVEKGKVTLLGKKPVHANVVDTPDFADFIVEHMCDDNKMYDVGGKETYSYEELAKMFFAAAGKEPNISYAPTWLFDVLAWVNKLKKNGKEAIIKFSKWTLTEEMVGDTIVGDHSFAEYIKNCYKK